MARLLKYVLYLILGIAALATGLIVYLVWVQPPLYFPRPTGQYAVGATTYHWLDAKCHDNPITFEYGQSTSQARTCRELMVKIWYPVSGLLADKPTTPYVPYLVDYCKKNQKLTWLSFGLYRAIYSYAKPGAALANDVRQFPVIIFSHGISSTYDGNTVQCEELASHGYVVVGISHTHDSYITQFPDGHTVIGIQSIKKWLGNFTTKQADRDIEIRISDICFVLDQLEQLAYDKKSMFYQRFDRQHIGIFGHSFGGAAAVQVCRRDARIKAGVHLDGPLFGSSITVRFNKPFMFMLAGGFTKIFDESFKKGSINEKKRAKLRYLPAIDQLARSIGHDAYVCIVKTAGHLDFTDIALLKNTSPFCLALLKVGTPEVMTGSIDGLQATKIVNAYLVNFFDKYLKGLPSVLLDGTDKPYPEVETKQW